MATLYKGKAPGGEYLLTVHDDGTHEIAFRAASWETWGPPSVLSVIA